MRYISILAMFLLLIGVGLTPRGASAEDELSGSFDVMPSPSETALAALITPLTKLTDKVFPDSSGVVAEVLPRSGDPATEWVVVGVQYGEGMGSYSKLNSDLIDSWLALLSPDDLEAAEMDGKAILEARDALLLTYAGSDIPTGDDAQATTRSLATEATA